MDDNSDKLDLEHEVYNTIDDPERDKMMKMHEQDVQEFLEEYDDSDGEVDPQEYTQQKKNERLTGIRGWLVLIIIILSMGILSGAFDTVMLLTKPSLIVSTFDFILTIVTTLLNIFLLVILARKLWFFPRMYQIVIGTAIINKIVFLIIGEEVAITIASIIFYSLWLVYLHYSKRVKNTFIYRWSGEIRAKSAAKVSEA